MMYTSGIYIIIIPIDIVFVYQKMSNFYVFSCCYFNLKTQKQNQKKKNHNISRLLS